MKQKARVIFSPANFLLTLFVFLVPAFNLSAKEYFSEKDFYQSWVNVLSNPQDYQTLKDFEDYVILFRSSDFFSIDYEKEKSYPTRLIIKADYHAKKALKALEMEDLDLWIPEFKELNSIMTQFFISTIENDKRYVLPFVQLLTILSISILISAFILAIYLRNKRKINLLTEKYKQEQLVTKTITQVQENERTRISRDLHDTITQDIRAELLLVHKLQRSTDLSDYDSSLLQRIRKIGEGNLLNIRSIIRNLTPPEIENADFISLLTEFASNTQEKSGMEIKFYAENSPLFKKLKSLEKLHIFRIIQEAVNNAIKHSGASEIGIFARENFDEENKSMGLVFLISDDGKGMDTNQNKEKSSENLLENSTHLGIMGMKSRAGILGAELTIKSSGETGTQIKLTLPF